MCSLGYGCDLYVSAWGFHQVWTLLTYSGTGAEQPVRYSQADPRHYCGDNARILGLCTGALAAAAVSCSRSTLELIPLAVEAVILAFRTGMHVTDVAQRVEPSGASDRSWSLIVPGVEVGEAAVKGFCEQTVRIAPVHDLLHATTASLSG